MGMILVVSALVIYAAHPSQVFGSPQFQGPDGGSGQDKTPSGSLSSSDPGAVDNFQLSPPNAQETSNPPVNPQLAPLDSNVPGVLGGGSSDSGGASGGGGAGGGSNTPPVMISIDTQRVNQTELLMFTVRASDPEGQVLTYSANNLPLNSSFDTATQEFSWVPLTSQHGSYLVNFSVSDGVYSANEDVKIYVYTQGNQPPVWTIIPAQSVNETELLSLQVNAVDPDGDPVTYSASGIPVNALFDAPMGLFTWIPSIGQTGTYTVMFTASDGMLQANSGVGITVNPVGGPTPVPEFPLPGVPVAILAAVALLISMIRTKKPGQ